MRYTNEKLFFFCFSCFVAEEKIRNILNANINEVSVDQIEDAITANNLCDCRNPITTAFEVSALLNVPYPKIEKTNRSSF